jgi:hypothetical protein
MCAMRDAWPLLSLLPASRFPRARSAHVGAPPKPKAKGRLLWCVVLWLKWPASEPASRPPPHAPQAPGGGGGGGLVLSSPSTALQI